MDFQILKKSKRSRARLGLLHTSHGDVETPALVTVATQATAKALTHEQVYATGTQLAICNTFHLHLKPGEEVIKKAGGLHTFMAWKKPLMTDSGGFQVFSLGFGRDFGMGKILKEKSDAKISLGNTPKLLKITDDGVTFTSYLDGRKVFLGPKESMQIQTALGADIIFAFDECTSPIADRSYTLTSLEKTHRWAKICIDHRPRKQALFGVVQGGKFADLRKESARVIASMSFDGFGIGGEFGDDKTDMTKMLRVVNAELPEEKPRHLLGIGHPDDIIRIIKEGVDTFDCTVPTHYARHGVAFTSRGRLDLQKTIFLKDKKALDPKCPCPVCMTHMRAYLAHLIRAKEMSGATLLSIHNLTYFHGLVAAARAMIKKNVI